MTDLKLFRLLAGSVEEIQGSAVAVERALQTLVESNLDALLGVRLVASEYSTGEKHRGRIDTLGLDENDAPVIIEYKRSTNENVINQGLFYLDWLMDHRAEFERLATRKLGPAVGDRVDWAAPRLLCIAGDFTRYDEHAVAQIDRHIELLRYRRYGDELMTLELMNPRVTARALIPDAPHSAPQPRKQASERTVRDSLAAAPPHIRELFEHLDTHLNALGDDVQRREQKNYFAYRRIRNFACVEVFHRAEKLQIFLKVNPDSINLEIGFSRDVRNIGHFGTGDLELTLHSVDDLAKATPYIQASYEAG